MYKYHQIFQSDISCYISLDRINSFSWQCFRESGAIWGGKLTQPNPHSSNIKKPDKQAAFVARWPQLSNLAHTKNWLEAQANTLNVCPNLPIVLIGWLSNSHCSFISTKNWCFPKISFNSHFLSPTKANAFFCINPKTLWVGNSQFYVLFLCSICQSNFCYANV